MILFSYMDPEHWASQPHRHFQFLLFEEMNQIPYYKILSENNGKRSPLESCQFSKFHFIHCFIMLHESSVEYFASNTPPIPNEMKEAKNSSLNGEIIYDLYLKCIDLLMRRTNQLDMSYNLILTREWMLIIPRRCSEFGPLSVNSLGFIGLFLTKTIEEAHSIKNLDISTIYRNLCFPI
jgi:ATP adenylyltransferase/5',5'''-P-1,P-4-tetraphosphate phosphorylase II